MEVQEAGSGGKKRKYDQLHEENVITGTLKIKNISKSVCTSQSVLKDPLQLDVQHKTTTKTPNIGNNYLSQSYQKDKQMLTNSDASQLLLKKETTIATIPYKPKGGDVFLVDHDGESNNWEETGYQFYPVSRGRFVDGAGGHAYIRRRIYALVTPNCPKGNRNFKLISWILLPGGPPYLIQFLGDPTIEKSVEMQTSPNEEHKKKYTMLTNSYACQLLLKKETTIATIPHKPKGGDVFLVAHDGESTNWTETGYQFYPVSGPHGGKFVDAGQAYIKIRVYALVTPNCPKGNRNFKLISWTLLAGGPPYLIQFLGDVNHPTIVKSVEMQPSPTKEHKNKETMLTSTEGVKYLPKYAENELKMIIRPNGMKINQTGGNCMVDHKRKCPVKEVQASSSMKINQTGGKCLVDHIRNCPVKEAQAPVSKIEPVDESGSWTLSEMKDAVPGLPGPGKKGRYRINFGLVGGVLRSAFLGNRNSLSLVFKIIPIQFLKKIMSYQIKISDSAEVSTNCILYPNLTQTMEDLLKTGAAFVVEISNYDIIAGKFLAIREFLVKNTMISADECHGDPIDNHFYQKLRQKYLSSVISIKEEIVIKQEKLDYQTDFQDCIKFELSESVIKEERDVENI